MATTNISLTVPDDLLVQADKVAERYHVDRNDVLVSALEHYLDVDTETRAAIEDGIRQLDARESVSHEDALARYHAFALADKAA